MQGALPPSVLARLAGLAPNLGSSSPPSSSAPPTSSALGLPLPMSNAGEASSAGDDQAGSGAKSQDSELRPVPRSRSDLKKPMTIDVPFELVVACGADGVVIHPGGYRLSSKALKANDELLMRHLKQIVQTRRQVDPTIHPHPSIRFLVEPGGSEIYRDARRQTMLSGVDWPVAIQVSDSAILDNIAPGGTF
jgi:hypothetical protein